MIDINDLSYDIAYQNYLREASELNVIENINTFTACYNISESAEDKEIFGTYIYEGVVDLVKNSWQKFVNILNRFWTIFMEKINGVMLTKVNFLKRYEEIILHKPLKINGTVDGNYEEGIKRINSVILHPLSVDEIPNIPSDSKDEAALKNFDSTIIADYKSYAGKASFKDWCNAYFIGNDEMDSGGSKVDIAGMNMTNAFNFCISIDKTKNTLQQDRNTFTNANQAFEKSAQEMLTKFHQAGDDAAKKSEALNSTVGSNAVNNTGGNSNAINSNPPPKQETTPPKQEPAGTKTESGYLYGDGDAFLEVFATGSTDAGSNGTKPMNGKSSTPMTGKSPIQNNVAQGKASTAAGNKAAVGSLGMKTDAKNTDEEFNKAKSELQQRIIIYNNSTMGVLEAKINGVEHIFNDYYAIMKAHVESYIGQTGDNSETVQQTLTFPANPNTPIDEQTATEQAKKIADIELAIKGYLDQYGDVNQWKTQKPDEFNAIKDQKAEVINAFAAKGGSNIKNPITWQSCKQWYAARYKTDDKGYPEVDGNKNPVPKVSPQPAPNAGGGGGGTPEDQNANNQGQHENADDTAKQEQNRIRFNRYNI